MTEHEEKMEAMEELASAIKSIAVAMDRLHDDLIYLPDKMYEAIMNASYQIKRDQH